MLIKKEISKNKFKLLFVIILFVILFFAIVFTFWKFSRPKPRILQPSLQQPVFTQEQQVLLQQQLQQFTQEQEKNKENIKETNKNQKEKTRIVNKDERNIFKDFYKAKKEKVNLTHLTVSSLPPPPPPPSSVFNYQQGISLPPSQKLVDVVIYGFYVTEDKIFVLTNIGLLSHGSRISQNETVIDITKSKIITNQREIYF